MILEKEKKMKLTPKFIAELDAELFNTRSKVEKEKEVIQELERERRKKEKELDGDKEKIKKLESKLYEVKTNKEYQAMLKEIESAKFENDKIEEDILMLMEKIEDLKKDFEEQVSKLKKREAEIEKEKKEMIKELELIESTLEELKTQRDNLLGIVNSDLRSIYKTLFEKRGGIAVVNLKNGVCLGCNMNIPPQLFIEATKNKELIFCPSCNRIFYFKEE